MAEVVGDTSCTLHPGRQASARCPSCGRFFCAECITEHEGKQTCAACLGRHSPAEDGADRPAGRLAQLPVAAFLQLALAVLICWLFFHFIAGTLADMPDEVHDGTIWE